MKVVLGYIGTWALLTTSFGLGFQWHYGSVNWLDAAAYAAIFTFGQHFYSTTTARLDALERKVRSLEAINQANWEVWASSRRPL